jgi:hypothetical protein
LSTLAYPFCQLPDAFQDFASENFNGKRPSDALMTHCRRKLCHAQWDVLLDDDFLEAYKHGIMAKCNDELMHRFIHGFSPIQQTIKRSMCNILAWPSLF